MSETLELHENAREDIRIDLLCEDVIALTEHLRIKEEECKQLQEDKAELLNWLKVISDDIECYNEMLEINKVKLIKFMEKHKCDSQS